MGILRWLLTLLLFSFLVIFCVQNMDVIDLHFRLAPAPVASPISEGGEVPSVDTVAGEEESLLQRFSYEVSMPVFLVVLVSVVLGAAIGGLVGLADQIRLRSQIRKQGKTILKLENEVKQLRNLPLEEEGEEAFKS